MKKLNIVQAYAALEDGKDVYMSSSNNRNWIMHLTRDMYNDYEQFFELAKATVKTSYYGGTPVFHTYDAINFEKWEFMTVIDLLREHHADICEYKTGDPAKVAGLIWKLEDAFLGEKERG